LPVDHVTASTLNIEIGGTAGVLDDPVVGARLVYKIRASNLLAEFIPSTDPKYVMKYVGWSF